MGPSRRQVFDNHYRATGEVKKLAARSTSQQRSQAYSSRTPGVHGGGGGAAMRSGGGRRR